MSEWQPGQYGQRRPRSDERQSVIPEHLRRYDEYGQPLRDRQQEPRPKPRSPQQPPPPQRQMSLYAAWGCAAVAAVIAVAGWYTALKEHHGGTVATSAAAAAAQPDTEAGVRAAATTFYAFYSGGQWDQAWAGLAPSVQAKVSEATWAAVHAACPSSSDGIARVIKSVTVSGTSAVVAETASGVLGKLGIVSDAWTYSGSRWGIALPASSISVYEHSSVKADVAAAKKAGSCS